ncbi:hypothetical protein H0H92_013170, partial [Tricholoma furcatifolium]
VCVPDQIAENGGFQEYIISMGSYTAKIPSRISFETASSIPLCLGTATVGFYATEPHGLGLNSPFADQSSRGKYSGEPIVILGGATSNGQFAIQLASLSGFSPIITIASLRHTEYLKSIGATHVVDRNASEAELAEKISQVTTKPIETVYVALGQHPEAQHLGYRLVAKGGRLVTVNPQAVVEEKEGKKVIRVFGSVNRPHTRELGLQLYGALHDLLDEGLMKPNRAEVLPGGLEGIAAGLDRLGANKVSGIKLVACPQDTT